MMEEMLGFLPKQRQILLYSATFPLSVQKFMVRLSNVKYFSHNLDLAGKQIYFDNVLHNQSN